jgi:hypothetical protein
MTTHKERQSAALALMRWMQSQDLDIAEACAVMTLAIASYNRVSRQPLLAREACENMLAAAHNIYPETRK